MATLTFEPVDGGTRVESTIELQLGGPVRLLGPMFMRWYRKSWERGLENLKSMMEAGEL